MNTPPDRCQRCGYRVGSCTCAEPLTPVHATVPLGGYPDPMQPADVARVFNVDAKTVGRWAKTGRIPSFTTAGGHRRYRKADIQALLNRDPYTDPNHHDNAGHVTGITPAGTEAP